MFPVLNVSHCRERPDVNTRVCVCVSADSADTSLIWSISTAWTQRHEGRRRNRPEPDLIGQTVLGRLVSALTQISTVFVDKYKPKTVDLKGATGLTG